MTDYKKWDKFGEDLSDSDDEKRNKPQVTRLDSPASVTIGPNGSSIAIPRSIDTSKRDSTLITPIIEKLCENGGEESDFYWSQSRLEVIVRFKLNSNVKASDITCLYIEKKFDDAVDSNNRPKLEFHKKSTNELILSRHLKYDIIVNTEESLESPVDWEIKNLALSSGESIRTIEITLKKRTPIAGVTLWWNCVFFGDAEIDVTKIKGRSQSSSASQAVWEEAHALFKQKISQHEALNIDIGNDA